MKVTKQQLKQIIKEEVSAILSEGLSHGGSIGGAPSKGAPASALMNTGVIKRNRGTDAMVSAVANTDAGRIYIDGRRAIVTTDNKELARVKDQIKLAAPGTWSPMKGSWAEEKDGAFVAGSSAGNSLIVWWGKGRAGLIVDLPEGKDETIMVNAIKQAITASTEK